MQVIVGWDHKLVTRAMFSKQVGMVHRDHFLTAVRRGEDAWSGDKAYKHDSKDVDSTHDLLW